MAVTINGTTGITTPSETVTTLTATSGTIATPATGDNTTSIATTAFVNSSSLGLGQTWQDVTASRAVSPSTYTSPTKPIAVNIVATMSNGSTSLILTIGGVTLQGAQVQGVAGQPASITAVIPPSTVYSVAASSGTATLTAWRELR